MKYTEIPLKAITGDQLAIGSNTFIRMMTGESYSHVATLFWDEGMLMVFETTGMRGGFRVVTFGQWMSDNREHNIVFGVAPPEVHLRTDLVAERMQKHLEAGAHKYGWLTCAKVWLSQITRKKYGQWHRVCSTLSQYFWNAAGWKLGKLADPGDIIKNCPVRYSVEMK